MTLRKRIAEQKIAGKIEMVKTALGLLANSGALDTDETAAITMIGGWIAAGQHDLDAFDAAGLPMNDVATYVAGLLKAANDKDRLEATECAAGAIKGMAGRVDRRNPALAKEIRNV